MNDDLGKAIAAKIIISTWNGVAADEIGINDEKVVTRVGQDHDLSCEEFKSQIIKSLLPHFSLRHPVTKMSATFTNSNLPRFV